MHLCHSFSVLTGSAGSPLPPGASVVTLRLLSYRGFFGWSSAALPVLPASGLLGGVDAGVDAGAQHAASVQPGHAFAKAPTNVGSKAGGAAASGAAGTTCPPLPTDGAASGPARYGAAFGPRAARDAGALLQEMAGFSRGSLGPVAQHALLVVQRSQASRWAARPPSAHAIDASDGSPEDASADEYSMPVS